MKDTASMGTSTMGMARSVTWPLDGPPSGMLPALATRVMAWLTRAAQRRHLRDLDDRLLADIGLTRIDVPFYGGTLVPDYDYIIILPVDGDGFTDALGTWPAGVPSGFEIYAQFWVSDPGALNTLSGSNAAIGVTP